VIPVSVKRMTARGGVDAVKFTSVAVYARGGSVK
jgi:hypothetical protein